MKFFLLYTAIIEAIAGIALMCVPSSIILLLLESKGTARGEDLLSRLAGAAILTIAIFCGVFSRKFSVVVAIRIITLYNILVAAIFIYGAWVSGIQNIGIWMIILFHVFQILAAAIILSGSRVIK